MYKRGRLGLSLWIAAGISGACGSAPDTVVDAAPLSEPGSESESVAGCAAGDDWGNYAQGFFVDHCIACHKKDHLDDEATVRQKIANIHRVIEDDIMPKAQPLARPERTRILRWLTCVQAQQTTEKKP